MGFESNTFAPDSPKSTVHESKESKTEEKVIALFVSDGYGGFGDFLFGLKTCAEIQKRFEQIGDKTKIYLVTQATGKEKILKLKADKEFNVEVLDQEEFLDRNLQDKLACFIEGPVFNPLTHSNLKLSPDTPVLLLPEYTLADPAFESAYRDLKLNPKRAVEWVYSGFYENKGILLTEELQTVATQKEQKDFSFREKYWAELKPEHTEILKPNGQSVADYHQNTELSFVYNNDNNPGLMYQTPESQHKHFLDVHRAFTKDSSKNQDIVSIGKYAELRKKALKRMVPELKQAGYTHISFVDLESGKEEVYHNDPNALNQKKYRLLHSQQLTHRQVIALLALTDDLCGLTGDQSFSECFSAGKIIVYECFRHKTAFIEDFLISLAKLTQGQDVVDLAHLLYSCNFDTSDPQDKEKLTQLLSDQKVVSAYRDACKKLAKDYDLMNSSFAMLRGIRTPVALTKMEIEQYQKLIKESKEPVDILKLRRKGSELPFSVLKYPDDKGFYLLGHGHVALLGKGGWGKVKQAYYCDENGIINPEPIAIKIERTQNNIPKLVSEVGMFKSVYPPRANEPHLYHFGQRDDSDKAYSVFPKLPGMALDKYLTKNPNLSLYQKFAIIKAVFEVLGQVHEKEIAHLDLKLKNFLYDPDSGRAYLIDFGYSKKFNEDVRSDDFSMAETMPPEYFKGTKISGSIDMYSCVPLIMDIMHGSLSSLISEKLESALECLHWQDTKDEIRDVVTRYSDSHLFGEAFYQIDPVWEQDPGFADFKRTFMQETTAFNFHELTKLIPDPEIRNYLTSILTNLSDFDPTERMSANVAASRLAEILPKAAKISEIQQLKNEIKTYSEGVSVETFLGDEETGWEQKFILSAISEFLENNHRLKHLEETFNRYYNVVDPMIDDFVKKALTMKECAMETNADGYFVMKEKVKSVAETKESVVPNSPTSPPTTSTEAGKEKLETENNPSSPLKPK